MKILEGSQHFKGTKSGASVALGNFDGLHVGHQAIITAAIKDAGSRQVPSVVFTFEPHPGEVVGRGAPLRITTPDEKERLIALQNPDFLIVEKFTVDYASQSANEFVEQILINRLGVGGVFVGKDFGFGKGRQGDLKTLRSFSKTHEFSVEAIGAVEVDGERVSSSVIRRLVQQGEVLAASRRLTRPYLLGGKVVSGKHRGHKLGVHTANLLPEKGLVPGQGVYACIAKVAKEDCLAVCNIGVRPTFEEAGPVTIEAHLVDFSGNLYGQRLELQFLDRLRSEKRFGNPSDLVRQIQADISQARQLMTLMAVESEKSS